MFSCCSLFTITSNQLWLVCQCSWMVIATLALLFFCCLAAAVWQQFMREKPWRSDNHQLWDHEPLLYIRETGSTAKWTKRAKRRVPVLISARVYVCAFRCEVTTKRQTRNKTALSLANNNSKLTDDSPRWTCYEQFILLRISFVVRWSICTWKINYSQPGLWIITLTLSLWSRQSCCCAVFQMFSYFEHCKADPISTPELQLKIIFITDQSADIFHYLHVPSFVQPTLQNAQIFHLLS